MRKIRTLALLLGLLCLLTAPVRAEEGAPPEENGELPGAEEPAPADPIVLPVPPVLRTEPRDLSCTVGERVVLRTEAEAYDGGTLGFQWYMGRTADKAAMHPVNGSGAEKPRIIRAPENVTVRQGEPSVSAWRPSSAAEGRSATSGISPPDPIRIP